MRARRRAGSVLLDAQDELVHLALAARIALGQALGDRRGGLALRERAGDVATQGLIRVGLLLLSGGNRLAGSFLGARRGDDHDHLAEQLPANTDRLEQDGRTIAQDLLVQLGKLAA